MKRRQLAVSFVPAAIFTATLVMASSMPDVRTYAMQADRANAAGATVWDAVYSEAEAARGRTAYTAHCSGCHREDLSGYNGVLQGTRFMTDWREDNLENLFNKIKRTMPAGLPGSLSDDVYLDIVAYVLQANAFPAGNDELRLDALDRIRVMAKGGPQPVPAGAWVQVVGCLTPAPDNSWMLTNATEPVRTRDAETSAEELRADEAEPSGTRTFELLDVDEFNPALHKGHRMEAKGFLILSPKDRLNLTALHMVGASCGP